MIGKNGEINCLEFNARLGDPETQVIMRRLESDLFPVLYALSQHKHNNDIQPPVWNNKTALCVVMAAAGYPGEVRKGDPIEGIDNIKSIDSVVVFHAGTALNKDSELVTNGGRVLNVTALGSDLEQARERAYSACKLIQFSGSQYRSDIGKAKELS
jgi:phosphoribosylamine---glycine ligase